MTQEALNLALAALGNSWTEPGNLQYEIEQEAITAIKEALTPEQEPVAHPFEDASVISALSWAAGLIQKEYPAGHNGADSWLMNYADVQGERIRLADHRKWEKVHGRWQPKTTTPPQRTWVGLTRMELIKCGVLPFGMSHELYEAIEAKLKQKNG